MMMMTLEILYEILTYLVQDTDDNGACQGASRTHLILRHIFCHLLFHVTKIRYSHKIN